MVENSFRNFFLSPRKLEIEGPPYAILFIKTPSHDCRFVSPLQFIR